MSLYKKNGNWFIRYRDAGGVQRQIKAGELKTYAQALERKILNERNELKHFGRVSYKKVTLREALEKYYLDISLLKSFPAIKQQVDYIFKNASPDMDVKKIKKEYIMTFLTGKKLKPDTINCYTKRFKAFLNFCKKEGFVEEVPLIHRQKVALRVKYLTEKQFEELIEKASTDVRDACIIAVYTGLRKNEIFNLKWCDIDFLHGFVHVNDSKTNKRRDLALHKRVREVLNHRKQLSEKVFETPPTYYEIKKCFKIAGLEDFHFHDLRHTFASWLAIKGTSLQVIKELLGHSSINMTLRYAHLDSESLIKAITNL